ncbi:MAG: DUF1552 domain-containing protein [Sandaracinus sp.]|nr:DUF1552 domain-containing protein [Sandaracinus sp.]
MRRRTFARSLGAAALFAPFLAKLGQTQAQPRLGRAKYLCLMTSTGSNPALWNGSGPLFNASNAPLQRVADDIVLVSNLNGNGHCATHGSPGGLTGVGYSGSGHTSIDQYVASGLMAAGIRTSIPSLLLGGDPTQESSTFWRGGERLSAIQRPVAAFDAIFAGAPPSTDPTVPNTGADDRLRRRQSILDLMLGELEQLRGQLGAEERRKLELHTESIRALEMRLAGGGSSTGGEGPAPGSCAAPAGVENGDQVLVDDARCLDLAVTALGCDLTRVACVEFGHHQGCQVRLPGMAGGDWHSNYLHSNQIADLTALEAWLCEQFVLAMEKAKRIPAPDGDGTLFDQTLFVWARTMGDAVAHVDSDMRMVFGGGAGGYLRRAAGGRHVDARGQSHQRGLLNCAAALGVADLSSFGNGTLGGDSRLPLEEVAS